MDRGRSSKWWTEVRSAILGLLSSGCRTKGGREKIRVQGETESMGNLAALVNQTNYVSNASIDEVREACRLMCIIDERNQASKTLVTELYGLRG